MSRNGPTANAGIRPPQRRHPAEDPFTAPPAAQPQHWPPQYPEAMQQHAPYPEPQPAHGQYAEASAPQGQHPQGYYFPQPTAEPDPNYGYAPQAPAQAQQPPFSRFPPPPAQDYAPPAPQHAQSQLAQLQHAPAAPQWGQQPDPRGYDLGNYMPTASPGFAPAEPASFQPAPEHAHFQAQHDSMRMGSPQQGYPESDADYEDTLVEDEEEPRRGRRGLMIAAALVGAIGLGGALAYTYKTFVASSSVRAPVVKVTDFGPNKVKPDNADGKVFPYSDSKLANRLPDDANPARAAAPPGQADAQDERASDDPNAPRKVRIIPIQPGNAAAPGSPPMVPTGPAAAPARAANPIVTVPGVTLETMSPPPSAARAQLPPQALPPARAAAQPQPQVKVASVAPTAPAATDAAPAAKKAPPATVAAVPAAPAKKPVPKAAEANPAKTKTAAAPAVTSSAGTGGFVAVLSSQKSRMDALKVFADMQGKYSDVLSSKTPDVQEANLGEKGVWYRLVVGPPGSRDSASGICAQLKTAGYNGCWVTAY
jgi:hypothetical protein